MRKEFLNNCWHFEITAPYEIVEIVCVPECIPEPNFPSEYSAFEQRYMEAAFIQFPKIYILFFTPLPTKLYLTPSYVLLKIELL